MKVLETARDYIHCGHNLLTHPLMGSVKPNETPYKTIVLSKNSRKSVNFKSLQYIEDSINTTQKFIKNYNTPHWNDKILTDFSLIDYDLIRNAFE